MTGTIGDADKDGFWVERALLPPLFVRFRDAKLVLDPDTGEQRGVVAHDRDPADWVKPTVITTVAVFGTIAVLTHGLFPMCFFVRCFR